MLYTAVQAKEYWPMEWERCMNMHKHLQRTGVVNYQFILEKKMFATREGPEYRCSLVRWGEYNINNATRSRELLLETGDPKQMEAAFLILISEAEAQAKESQRVSMVP